MSDAIAPFDPTQIVGEVRKRVQATFASMIPDAEWEKLVAREVKLFLEGTPADSRYGSQAGPSGLRLLVHTELDAFFRQRIKDELAKPEWSAQWTGSKTNMSETVRALMVENAKEIFANAFGAMFQQALEGVKYMR